MMSLYCYFKPLVGLPSPNGPLADSMSFATIKKANQAVVEEREYKDSRPPCGRSEENLLDPVVRQKIDPPKIEQILEIFLSVWPTTVSPFMTATAKRSEGLVVSLRHGRCSPTEAAHTSLYSAPY